MLQRILIFQQLVRTFYIIILIVQQNYFSDLYPAKILDLSAKPFFPCTHTTFGMWIMSYKNHGLDYGMISRLKNEAAMQ